MLATAQKLSAIDEAEIGMELTRACMDLHQRDSAYLALEDAKQSLAAAAVHSSAGDQDTIGELTGELQKLEDTLQHTMPFGLTLH